MSSNEQTHYRACHLCEAICGLKIITRGEQVVSIKGDEQDPLGRGHICPKAVALQDLHEDPDRLVKPLKRNGDQWLEIEWEQAFEEAAKGLAAVQERYGADAIATYQGNPNAHNIGAITHAKLVTKQIKTRNRYSATSVDQLPHHLSSLWLYGHQFLIPVPDIDRTDYLLMLGGNPMASNGSIMTVPDFRKRVKALQARGGQMVVVDPRRTETAEIANQHHFIRPESDALLLLAILNQMLEQGCRGRGEVGERLRGLEAVAQRIKAFTPQRVSERTGIAATEIEAMARALRSERALCYGRMGVSTQRFGGLCQWLIALINLVGGNIDQPGGMMFPAPPIDFTAIGPAGHYNRHQSRVRGLPEFAGELPASAMAEEMLRPGEGQVRALLTIAGNPVLSTPNGVQLERALDGLDFMVSIDPYLNETTRFADLILPPASPLAHDHYDMVFHHFAVRDTQRFSEAIFPPREGALLDWEIFNGLGKALAKALDTTFQPLPSPRQVVDHGLSVSGLSVQQLLESPSGIDRGPLRSNLLERIKTPDGLIHCDVAECLADIDRVDQGLQQPPTDDLLLIGRRHVRCNNSWMHNSQRLVKGKSRTALLIHPQDAERLGLSEGASARLSSRVGEATVTVSITDSLMAGVVSLPHGWGHQRPGVRLGVASQYSAPSANDLTDDRWLDSLSGNAAVNGVPVKVQPLSGD
ncbi:molybdopterin oxidoreductase family protein [Aestuariirhabdus litorea]|uniref:Molybdopterin oxidoreductase family protein n=1 Tax=Aestuariirhabdus litorea TaxID=2528527 RepID=A0A3P3VP59_9GAMM|nr:molybdopterin oxidoreductase family protein [Aestuariirhabdus litorea]RRJ84137.1 molybdopterin oxidoreductase family protein [Aestuariirhabdus litorea]RWW97357.1 molybdopterin oxidoreductase family protein [Endozoicomonadaceae bacterium GTF-13]